MVILKNKDNELFSCRSPNCARGFNDIVEIIFHGDLKQEPDFEEWCKVLGEYRAKLHFVSDLSYPNDDPRSNSPDSTIESVHKIMGYEYESN